MPPEEQEEIRLVGGKIGVSVRLDADLPASVLDALRVQASATGYRHEERVDEEVEMAFGLRTQTFDLLLRKESAGGGASSAVGASGLFRQYGATGEDQLTAPADSRTMGMFVYQEISLSAGGAALQIGGRVDGHRIASRDDVRFGPGVTRGFTATSGSLGFALPLREGVSAALSVGRAFRAPTVEELFSDGFHLGTASYEIGDPSLRPEVSEGLDAVLRIHWQTLSVDVAGYGNRIAGFVHRQPQGDTIVAGSTWPVLAYLQSPATLVGIEGQAEWVIRRSLVLGGSGDVVRGALADGAPVPFLPAARVAASLRWEDGRRSLGAEVAHALAQQRTGLVDAWPTEAYTLVHVHAGLRILQGARLHSLQFRADNVLDALYRDAASRIKEFAPNPGRNLSLMYRVQF
jgi:iron complex outermembrane recepter protein